MTYSFHSSTVDGVCTVRARGELDCATDQGLRACLDAAVHSAGAVVVDLSEVTFLDCHALGVFVGAARQIAGRGGELVLADASLPARRVLDAFDMSPLLGGRRSVLLEQQRLSQLLAPVAMAPCVAAVTSASCPQP